MGIRSDILVHWTGKNICTNPALITQKNREEFVERLRSILLEGFWMTKPTESLYGNSSDPDIFTQLSYFAHITCFTEIRLSRALEHASRYGTLGVGVDRKFVLDRLGGPVHYVRNWRPEQVVGNTHDALTFVKMLESDATYKIEAERIGKYMTSNLCFLKGMSNKLDDFIFLEENEWRVTHVFKLEDEGYVIKVEDSYKDSSGRPYYKLILKPDDIRVLVFPDDLTRSLALKNPQIKEWLSKGSSETVMLTLKECGEF